jgi:hypothetical protein
VQQQTLLLVEQLSWRGCRRTLIEPDSVLKLSHATMARARNIESARLSLTFSVRLCRLVGDTSDVFFQITGTKQKAETPLESC